MSFDYFLSQKKKKKKFLKFPFDIYDIFVKSNN